VVTAVGNGVLDEGVVVSMHGRAGQIRLSDYVDVLQQVRLSLDELDGRLRPTRTGKARWGVRHMPDDFGLRDLIAPVSVPKRRDPASLRLSTTTLVSGVSKLSEEPGLPAAFSPALVERLQRVGDAAPREGSRRSSSSRSAARTPARRPSTMSCSPTPVPPSARSAAP